MVPRQRLTQSPPATLDDSSNLQEPLVDASNSSSSAEKDVLSEQIKTERERWRHDLFNVVALLPVIVTSLMNWNLIQLFTGHGPNQSWNGNYFLLNWSVTMMYFMVDFFWVALIPTCVKSPDVILKHHLVTMAYLFFPLYWPGFRWFMGACLSVEINTWFLIVRRVLFKRKDKIPPIFHDVVSFCFYTSWISIRCFVYPYVLYDFLRMTYVEIVETKRLHWLMICVPIHFFLCVLNLKWTYELFQPMVARRFGAAKEEVAAVSSGL